MNVNKCNASNEGGDDFQVESLCICSVLSQRRCQLLRSQALVDKVRP